MHVTALSEQELIDSEREASRLLEQLRHISQDSHIRTRTFLPANMIVYESRSVPTV